MLKEIRIENLALIERLHLVLADGLTVFSGETGAGKSIVLQAIALLTGAKATASWVRTGAAQAVVEALFDWPESPAFNDELAEAGLAGEEELLVKRVVSADGKSRFYLNGGLATARLVQSLGEHLVSVASQHDHQRLLNPKYHLDFIDLAGDLWPTREAFAGLYDQWSVVRKELEALREREMDKEQRRDFLSYQVREIDAAAVAVGEDEQLGRERLRLKGSADLRKFGQRCYQALQSASESMASARKDIEAIAAIDREAAELATSVREQGFLVDEFGAQVRAYLHRVPDDESALEEISTRITQLQQLKRKYGEELADILAYADKARRELAELDALDESIGKLEKRCAALETDMIATADGLSRARRQVALRLGAEIRDELRALSFAQAEFVAAFKEVDREPLQAMTRTGWDRCEFMFSANPGEPAKPLASIASGGELSRVMLALKCLLAKQDSVETVIFDEIDAGIGGKAAESVARKIRELSRHHQVICITHLPQIAAAGTSHFLVEKRLAEGRTSTAITHLDHSDRLPEIARMLDGDSVSPQTLAFAAELIERHHGSSREGGR